MNPMRPALLIVSVLLAGCATGHLPPPNLSDRQALLAPGVVCDIPTPDANVRDVSAAQNIVVHAGHQTFGFQAQIQISGPEIDLAALDNLGRRGMTVKWRDGRLDVVRAEWLPEIVRPADILMDIAIVFWPEATAARALASCGAELREMANGRSVRAGNGAVLGVSYDGGEGWSRTAHLHNPAFGLVIDIQSTALGR
jgi:hypothetical protein